MSLKIKVSSSEDIEFEAALLLASASNYSDGQDKGFRPAISWAMVVLPNTIIRSGLYNIKDQEKQNSAGEAKTVARAILFDGDCICSEVVDSMLEEFAAEG